MKKDFYVIIFLFLTSSITYSQTWEWAKSYGDQFDDIGSSIGIDKNNNLYVSGFNWYTNGGGPNPTGFWYELLSKFNHKGELIWKDTIPFFNSKVRTDADGNSYIFNDQMYFNSRIGKYDNNGNKKWVKLISSAIITDIAVCPNGDIVVAAYNNSGTNLTVGNTTVPNNYGFIAKADKDLNWQWVNPQYFYGIFSIAISTGGKIFTAGGSYGGSDSSCVRVFESSGNCINRFIKASKDLEYIAIDNNENIYLAGNISQSFPLSINNNPIQFGCGNCSAGYVLKFNSNGEMQWQKIIQLYVTLNSLKCDGEGNAYVAGSIMRTFQIDTFLLYNHISESYVAKFDEDAKLLWVKNSDRITSTSGSSSGISDMILDSENNPIVTGAMGGSHKFGDITLTDHAGDWQDLLLAKIYQEPKVVSPEVANNHSNGLLIYPNPNGGNFSVYYENSKSISISVTVKNGLGQTILIKTYQDKISLNETFDLSHLAKGVYFIQVNTDQATEVRKIIIE